MASFVLIIEEEGGELADLEMLCLLHKLVRLFVLTRRQDLYINLLGQLIFPGESKQE